MIISEELGNIYDQFSRVRLVDWCRELWYQARKAPRDYRAPDHCVMPEPPAFRCSNSKFEALHSA